MVIWRYADPWVLRVLAWARRYTGLVLFRRTMAYRNAYSKWTPILLSAKTGCSRSSTVETHGCVSVAARTENALICRSACVCMAVRRGPAAVRLWCVGCPARCCPLVGHTGLICAGIGGWRSIRRGQGGRAWGARSVATYTPSLPWAANPACSQNRRAVLSCRTWHRTGRWLASA
jgi:hypothetical protein